MLTFLVLLSCFIDVRGFAVEIDPSIIFEHTRGISAMDNKAKPKPSPKIGPKSLQSFFEYKVYSGADSKCDGNVITSSSIRLDECLLYYVIGTPYITSVVYNATVTDGAIHIGATFFSDYQCSAIFGYFADVFPPFSTTCEETPTSIGLGPNNNRIAAIVPYPTASYPDSGLLQP